LLNNKDEVMKPSIFLNDMLTKGAILGGVMLVSSIAETSMLYYGNSPKWIIVMSVECIVAMALYCYLVYRFTKGYATLVLSERKQMPFFTYGNGLSYATSISMLAGIIVALGGYMFRHYIVGYENYIANYVKLLQDWFSQSEVPASMVGTYEQMFKTIQLQEEPSLISSIFSGVWSYLVAGTIVGLIVAAFTKHEPKIFENQDEQ
jgi:hypothetical protein